MTLDELIDEGLRNSPDILASQARADAAGYRIPQAKSLPDPMFMFGYQNEGFQRLTLGSADAPQAMGMSSLSQMFYFPGKRALKGEMATRDAESLAALSDAAKHRVVAQIKVVFYDLFLAYKTLDILKDRTALFSKIEDAAQSRYASGTGMEQEVIMAQTEKYMILEKEEMQRQRMQALQGMLNATVGREVGSPLGRPTLPPATRFPAALEEVVSMAKDHSPDVRSKQKMVEGAEAKVKMAKKEYYPDVTVGASWFPRTGGMVDMWNLTFTVNLPIYYRTKQQQAVGEAEAGLSGSQTGADGNGADARLQRKGKLLHGAGSGQAHEALQRRAYPEGKPGRPARLFELRDGKDRRPHRDHEDQEPPRLRPALLEPARGEGKGDREAPRPHGRGTGRGRREA